MEVEAHQDDAPLVEQAPNEFDEMHHADAKPAPEPEDQDLLGHEIDLSGPSAQPVPLPAPMHDDDDVGASKGSFWNIAYYRPHFNVNTAEVRQRLIASAAPMQSWRDVVGRKPDMYGPFWVATTLVFLIAVSGNVASFIAFEPSDDKVEWTYDFTKITMAASLVYGFAYIVPICVWGFLRYFDTKVGLLDLVCNYGYAMSPFLPVAVLCIIPSELVRWILLAVGTGLSGGCILKHLWECMQTLMPSDFKAAKVPLVLVGVAGLHLVLGLLFKLYFFHYAT